MCIIFRVISLALSKRNRNYIAERGVNPQNSSCTQTCKYTHTYTKTQTQSGRYQFSNVLLISVALNFKTNNSFFCYFHAADITAIIADLYVVK